MQATATFTGIINYNRFGMLMLERSIASAAYRYGFGGHEKDDEIKGSGNHLSFGDYGYDTRLGRRWNIDPKTAKAPNESPYAVFGNNPIFYTDPDGKFKLNYTEQQLKDNGLTKLDVVRFENIVNNIYNLVKDNPQALEAISNTTGFSLNKIEQDFQAGSGPTIDILPVGGGARGGASGIVFDPIMIKSLAGVDGSDEAKLSKQTLGMALTVIHEYGHHGDQVTNEGNNTGQFVETTTKNTTGSHIFRNKDSERLGGNNKERGKQYWKTSLTGHRGTDIEVAGFGVDCSVNDNGSINIEKGKYSKTTTVGNLPTIPNSLPNEAKGKNVLETLKVK
jgi:RHS repeat-associated protein